MVFLRISEKLGGHATRNKLSGAKIHEHAGHYEGARIQSGHCIHLGCEGARIHRHKR